MINQLFWFIPKVNISDFVVFLLRIAYFDQIVRILDLGY